MVAMSIVEKWYDMAKANTKAKHLCQVKRCRNERAGRRKVCHAHHMSAWRKSNPDKSAYFNLKNHAKSRGIVFSLTFDQFLEIAIKSRYIDNKGCFADNLHFDRINPLLGYSVDNIQVISGSENCSKGATYDKAAHIAQKLKRYEEENSNNPF